MGCREGEVVKKRFSGMLARVLFQHLDGVISQRRGRVEIGILLHRRQRFVIEPVLGRIEEPPLIFEVVRTIEALLHRHAIDVPFPGVVGPVTERLE